MSQSYSQTTHEAIARGGVGEQCTAFLGIPVASKIASFRRPISKHTKWSQFADWQGFHTNGVSSMTDKEIQKMESAV
jgi:hypothetical protein